MERYLKWLLKYRVVVLILTALITLGLLAQLKSLKVIIDPDAALPQSHPFIITGNVVESLFGNKFTVVIGISAKNNTIYQTHILEKVAHITDRIAKNPASIKSNIISLSARKAKDIQGVEDGMIISPLMEKIPQTAAEILVLEQAVERMNIYSNFLVSADKKTTQIVAEFKSTKEGFHGIEKMVREIIAPELDDSVDIHISGLPIFLALLEKYSSRMGFLFPIALLIIGLLHFEAFRTVQALVLPLVTALLAVIWSLGILGLLNQPFDVFNASTPILILAIAAGHAVQILKRYYEE
ncbi:MAG: MMPL family transporter, partial [Silvanigrellaceae bacterium]|nr:MMPL family transporter [Silvanigrellaceae bacterium]